MRRSSRRRLTFLLISLTVVTAVGYGGFYQYRRPLPQLQPVSTVTALKPTAAPMLKWPAYGQSAIGTPELGLLGSSGSQTPVPIASVTKVVTALTVLQKNPLAAGHQGPTLTLDTQDVGYYHSYVAQGGSVVGVTAGEQISQYQALQALLLPSANNMADSLARWAYGSMDSYLSAANNYLRSQGLRHTKVADASGFSDQSVSTAEDLVLLGRIALGEPVIADIVGQKEASVPVAGIVRSTNWLLGSEGVVGIKTGNTDQAGGCYLFAGQQEIDGQNVIVIGAILGAPTLTKAMDDSRGLLTSAYAGFSLTTVVKKGQLLGYYDIPWAKRINAVAGKDLAVVMWPGRPLKVQTDIQSINATTVKNTRVGGLKTTNPSSRNIDLVLQESVPAPTWKWRVLRN